MVPITGAMFFVTARFIAAGGNASAKGRAGCSGTIFAPCPLPGVGEGALVKFAAALILTTKLTEERSNET